MKNIKYFADIYSAYLPIQCCQAIDLFNQLIRLLQRIILKFSTMGRLWNHKYFYSNNMLPYNILY